MSFVRQAMMENDFTRAAVRRDAIYCWEVVEPHGDKMDHQVNKHLLGKARVW